MRFATAPGLDLVVTVIAAVNENFHGLWAPPPRPLRARDTGRFLSDKQFKRSTELCGTRKPGDSSAMNRPPSLHGMHCADRAGDAKKNLLPNQITAANRSHATQRGERTGVATRAKIVESLVTLITICFIGAYGHSGFKNGPRQQTNTCWQCPMSGFFESLGCAGQVLIVQGNR